MNDKQEKLLLFDFDGTLHDYGVVLPETYEALEYARKKGCKLFINTGRTKFGLLKDLQNTIKFNFDGILCCGSIYLGKDYDNAIVTQNPIRHELVDKFLKFVCEKSYWTVLGGSKGYHTVEMHGGVEYTEQEKQKFYADAVKASKEILPLHMCVYPPAGVLDPSIPLSFPELSWIEYTQDRPQACYENFQKGYTKDCALKRLADYYGTKIENVISFGDSENDIPAFKASGKSVAMAKSSKPVKEVATFIATTPAGVAEGIYHYIK